MPRTSGLAVCLLAALLSAACECDCDSVAGPSPIQPPPSLCTLGPPVLSPLAVTGRIVTGRWTPASQPVRVLVEEESGQPGNYLPLSTARVDASNGLVTFTAQKDGRYRLTVTLAESAACGSSSRTVLIDTAPPPEPPPPPPNPPAPPVPPCVAGFTLNPECRR